MGRVDISAAVEEEFNDRYNTAYTPPYLTVSAASAPADTS